MKYNHFSYFLADTIMLIIFRIPQWQPVLIHHILATIGCFGILVGVRRVRSRGLLTCVRTYRDHMFNTRTLALCCFSLSSRIRSTMPTFSSVKWAIDTYIYISILIDYSYYHCCFCCFFFQYSNDFVVWFQCIHVNI